MNRNPIICADNGTTWSLGSGLVAARSARDAVLHEPHVVDLALLIRFAVPHGDEGLGVRHPSVVLLHLSRADQN